MRNGRLPLSVLISALVLATIVASLAMAYWVFSADLRDATEEMESARVMSVARALAQEPWVVAAATEEAPPPHRRVEELRQALGVDFIVLIDKNGRRLSHPDTAQVGKVFSGRDTDAVLHGESLRSRAAGPMGVSLRGLAPIIGASQTEEGEREVIGAVAVGTTLASLMPKLERNRHRVLLGIALITVLGGMAAVAVANGIKGVLLGLEPFQIAHLVEERQAMLGSIHEGLIAIDAAGRVVLVNPAGEALFRRAGAGTPKEGAPIAGVLPQAGLEEVLAEGKELLDRSLMVGDLALMANCVPIIVDGVATGAIATLRDKTEVRQLAEELTGVRLHAEGLRAAAHEFKNKLHVLSGLVSLGEMAALRDYLRDLLETHAEASAAVAERVTDPIVAGFLLGKQSEAHERAIRFDVRLDGILPAPGERGLSHAVVNILGPLIDNAFDAVAGAACGEDEPWVRVSLELDEGVLSLTVEDNGGGIPEALRSTVFDKGVSTKGVGRGLGLSVVKDALEANGGTISLYSATGGGTLIECSLPYQTLEEDDA